MKKLALLFCMGAVLSITSCGKDEESSPEIYEFTSYLIKEEAILQTEFDEQSDGGSSYEMGWKFTVTSDGEIRSLGGLFPDAADHTVTLWNSEGILVAQVSVTAISGKLVSNKIEAVEVLMDEIYTISYRTNGENYYYKNGATYPIVLDYITVTAYVESGGDVVVFPSGGPNSFAGVPEIGFVPN